MKIEKQRKMENETPDCQVFINHVGNHYKEIETKLKMLSGRNHQPFDKDAYQEVIIKCYKRIQNKGTLNDKTPYGIESYLIKSYFNYLIDVKRSAEKQKRDLNYIQITYRICTKNSIMQQMIRHVQKLQVTFSKISQYCIS